ncbi:ras homolog gene family, member D (predicted), isoform CRA_a [Rattus norvegicus]|uniref:Ras homolog gene family, member D (Predicted), isoform CRA_a n=1 Tax=Rattus norvegicus TaxID=10116 RepID=A6HYX4_RAT|nr:ras homolog gene family, member D (predicted), isoform CRA_a [Rattus norvegicus]
MNASQTEGEEAPHSGRPIKVVLVGDGGCGKTSLMMVFANGAFPESYNPTVFERYNATLQMKGKPVRLQIWDTAGQDDYDRLRPLFYPDANVLLLCFDVTNPNSFDNVSNRWYPEVTHFCKGVPIIVVGCKIDLRKDKVLVNTLRKKRLEPVTYHRVGRKLAVDERHLGREPQDTSLLCQAFSTQGLGGRQQSGRVSTWKQNPEYSRSSDRTDK